MSNGPHPFNQSHPTGTLLHSVLALKLHNPATGTMHANRKGKKKRTPDTNTRYPLFLLPPLQLHSTPPPTISTQSHSTPLQLTANPSNTTISILPGHKSSHPTHLNTLLTPPPACPHIDRPYASSLSPVYVIIVTLSSGASTQGFQE